MLDLPRVKIRMFTAEFFECTGKRDDDHGAKHACAALYVIKSLLDGQLSDVVHIETGVIILDYPGAGKVHDSFMLDFAAHFLTRPSAEQAIRRNNNMIWRPNYDNRSCVTERSTQQTEECFPEGFVGDASKDRHMCGLEIISKSSLLQRDGAARRFTGARERHQRAEGLE
jgi:hypothetical protein